MSSRIDHSCIFPKRLELFINGEFVDAESKKVFPIIDPQTEQVLCNVAEGDLADVNKAVDAAEKALNSDWKLLGHRGRANLLLKLADRWVEESEKLAQLECLNNGSPLFIQSGVIASLQNELRYHAGWADKIDGRQVNLGDEYVAYTCREPLGVCGFIVAWNFPIWCIMVKLAPCLAMGNTVVIKPAEQTPLTALRLAELCHEVGFPPGVINVIPGYGPTAGAAIANHMKIRKVAFTGSTEIGREILRGAANSNLKQVQLELGGKSPLVIFPDANLDDAVEIAGWAVFGNNGQSCDAASRCFVHESIYDDFVEKAVKFASSLVVGDPLALETQIGPIVDKHQYQKILEYIESGKKEGARVSYDGNEGVKNEKGYFIHPVVFSNVTDDMTIAKEEIFGPVQQILKFSSVEEVIERANSVEYGLAAGVVSNNFHNITAITKNVKAGTVWANMYGYVFPEVEFGGQKQSGFGREGGATALSEWTQLKSVVMKVNKPQLN